MTIFLTSFRAYMCMWLLTVALTAVTGKLDTVTTAYHGRAFDATKGCGTPLVWWAVLTAHQDECGHDPNWLDDQAWDTLVVTVRGRRVLMNSMNNMGILTMEHLLIQQLPQAECILNDGKPKWAIIDSNHHIMTAWKLFPDKNFIWCCDIVEVWTHILCSLFVHVSLIIIFLRAPFHRKTLPFWRGDRTTCTTRQQCTRTNGRSSSTTTTSSDKATYGSQMLTKWWTGRDTLTHWYHSCLVTEHIHVHGVYMWSFYFVFKCIHIHSIA